MSQDPKRGGLLSALITTATVVGLLLFATTVYAMPKVGGGGPEMSGTGAIGGVEAVRPYQGPCMAEELDILYIEREVTNNPRFGGLLDDVWIDKPSAVSWLKAKLDPMDSMPREPRFVWMIQVRMNPMVMHVIFFDMDACDTGSVGIPVGAAEDLLYMSGHRERT